MYDEGVMYAVGVMVMHAAQPGIRNGRGVALCSLTTGVARLVCEAFPVHVVLSSTPLDL